MKVHSQVARHPGSKVAIWNTNSINPPFWYYGVMAVRKMTFSVPEPLALQLIGRVASRDRSRFISEALAAHLKDLDLELIRACEAANEDLDVRAIEREFDEVRDDMAEPWK